MNQKLQTLESMMRYHLDNKTGRTALQTMLPVAELKRIGIREFDGKYTHQVKHGGAWHTFEVLPG